MHKEDHEDSGSEVVLLTLVTTTGRMREMDCEGKPRGTAADKVMAWRHYTAALRYLRNTRERCLDVGKYEEPDMKLKEYERLERLCGESIRKSLWDWEHLVDGAEGESLQEEKETPKAKFRISNLALKRG